MTLLEMMRLEGAGVVREVQDKAAALRLIARLAKTHPALAEVPEDAIVRGLEAREALGSTGLARSVALPHCRLAGLEDFAAGVLSVREGVRFGSLDGRKTRVFIYVVAPEGREETHLEAMAGLAGLLKDQDMAEVLGRETTAAGLFRRFGELWRARVEAA
jgi:PTS system nitrogen regulatory IIA component